VADGDEWKKRGLSSIVYIMLNLMSNELLSPLSGIFI